MSAEPAVPLPETTPKMTLRDWFAGQALAASEWAGWDMQPGLSAKVADACYAKADAMMVERRKRR